MWPKYDRGNLLRLLMWDAKLWILWYALPKLSVCLQQVNLMHSVNSKCALPLRITCCTYLKHNHLPRIQINLVKNASFIECYIFKLTISQLFKKLGNLSDMKWNNFTCFSWFVDSPRNQTPIPTTLLSLRILNEIYWNEVKQFYM